MTGRITFPREDRSNLSSLEARLKMICDNLLKMVSGLCKGTNLFIGIQKKNPCIDQNADPRDQPEQHENFTPVEKSA